jgi:hypothetical protein
MKSKSQYSNSLPGMIFFTGILLFIPFISESFSQQVFNKNIPENIDNQSVVSSFNPRVRFEKNVGQTDPQVDYLCRGKNHILYLTPTGSVLHLLDDRKNNHSVLLQMQIVGANPGSKATGMQQLKSRSNYFHGNDPDSWLTDIPHYSCIKYEGIYQGIDLVYYIRDKEVEFDFVIEPGIQPDVIHLSFAGANEIKLNHEGDLVVQAGSHELVYKKPVAWQRCKEDSRNVDVQFTLADNNIGFDLGEYDKNKTLIIDPQFVYATYLGGSEYETGYAIAADADGCAYVTGSTSSTDFPTYSSFQNEKSEGMFSYLKDIFVTKFNPEGSDIIFSTYIGGNWDDEANGIALDASNNIYIAGTTFSEDNPDTPEDEGFPLMSAYQNQIGDDNFSDAFLTVLNNTGTSLLYSTYFGGDGEDQGTDIAVGIDGNAYITGINFSFDMPVKNAYMSSKPSYYYDAFVARLNPYTSGDNSLIYATYLGGNYDDWGYGIAVDREGCAYVTGSAKSTDFPTTPDPIQSARKESSDVFVSKLSADGLSLVYSTYLGSDGSDEGKDIEVDTAGCAYVCGMGSSGFPVTPGAFMTSGSASFVSKLMPDGKDFVYSTHVLQNGKIAVDDTGQVYIATGLAKMVGDVYKADARVIVLNPEGSDTLFTMTFGGSENESARDVAVDNDRSIYLVGYTNSPDFPVENAFQASLAGQNDVFVAKFGKSKKKLVVEVLQDPLNHDALPIPNTLFDIYAIDLSNRSDPLNYIETQATNDEGLLHLSPDYYAPGMPVFIQHTAEKIPAMKKNHFNEAENMYHVYVDNLIFENNGNIEAQLLEDDQDDTTRTYLSHTSLGYNLIVSIEWLASADYITNLIGGFIQVSNLLYDITNGHVFIDYVAIYDNKNYWKDADIQIYADNYHWPAATAGGIDSASNRGNITLPPAFYDSETKKGQLTKLYEADPIDPGFILNVTSIGHELGHYVLGFEDEYENATGTTVSSDKNFGFMDNPDDLNDPMSSEMSDFVNGDPLFSSYSLTEHYQLYQQNCWDKLSDSHSRFYNSVRAFIHTPRDLGIASNNVMAGPNSDLDNPDFSVGEMMGFDIMATMTAIPRRDYLVTSPNGNLPVPYAQVRLEKQYTGRKIEHGWTTPGGFIKLFNAEPGDKIWVVNKANNQWRFRETLVGQATKQTGNNTEIIELKEVSGNFALLSGIEFDATGKPVYLCRSDQSFSSAPEIRIYENDSVSEEQTLSLSEDIYSVALSNPGFSEGSVLFTAPDSLGEYFFIPQNAYVLNLNKSDNSLYLASMQLELVPDQAITTAEKIALLASYFPAPLGGLPDSVLQVSDVISLNIFPDTAKLKMRFQIHYQADSIEAAIPEAMIIYKWEDGWIPMETGVDPVHKSVTSFVEGPGHYAVFLDLTQSRVVTGNSDVLNKTDQFGGQLFPGYPNPFRFSTTIGFELPERSKVILDVFDIHGRKIRTLVNTMMDAGKHDTIWDGTNDAGLKVPAGIYFYVFKTGTINQNQKIILMR